MKTKSVDYSSTYLQSNSKRLLDIFFVTISFLPLLFIVSMTGLLLLVIEGRPILFRHYRVGNYGNFIDIIKLRTLKIDSDPYISSPKATDLKFVRIGKFLRRYKIDEVPQLISVIKGEMSFVGPRPEMVTILSNYKDSHLRHRLSAKPGLTGLWQIKADTERPIYENIKYDLYYIKHASLWLDIKIVLFTVIFLFRNKVV